MISVILPTYNEEDNLLSLHSRLVDIADSMHACNFEFIFIDDCSTDKTPDLLQRLRKKDDRVNIIRFSRNCGSYTAVAAGLDFCKGDVAIMHATDLQDPPEIIPQLYREWRKGFKIVWGVREKREGETLITRGLSRIFYFLMNRLTDVKQPSTGADVFLIDRVVIEAYKQSPEKNTSLIMLIAWLGFSQSYIKYVKEARHAGASKWTFSKRVKLFLDALISFSYIPLRFMSLMGVTSAFLGLIYSIFVFINALRGLPVQGWASLMIAILIIGGFQMIMLGMLGEYLWRTYDETRGRPKYVIEKNTLTESSVSGGSKSSDGQHPQRD